MILSEWPWPFTTHLANVLNLIFSSWKIDYSLKSTIQQSKPRSNKIGTYKAIVRLWKNSAKPLDLTACFLLQVASPFKTIYVSNSIYSSIQNSTALMDWFNTWESPEFDECMTAAHYGFFCKAVAYIVWPVPQSSNQVYVEIQSFPFVALIRTYSGYLLQRAGRCLFSTASRYSAGNEHAGWTWCLEHHLFAE